MLSHSDLRMILVGEQDEMKEEMRSNRSEVNAKVKCTNAKEHLREVHSRRKKSCKYSFDYRLLLHR